MEFIIVFMLILSIKSIEIWNFKYDSISQCISMLYRKFHITNYSVFAFKLDDQMMRCANRTQYTFDADRICGAQGRPK